MTPRGLRNRNPLNIETSGWTIKQDGYTGPEPEGRFATFQHMSDGLAAAMRLLQVYRKSHGLTTLRGIVNRWAPPSDANDVTAYLATVSKVTGYGIDQELPDEPYVYHNIVRAMAMHENGRDAAIAGISDRDYSEAMALVFGITQAAGVNPPASPPTTAPSSPAPSTERKMSPLVIPAITAIVEAIPSLLRIFKGDSRTVERNAKAVEVISAVVKDVTGEASVAGAAEKVLTDPAVKAQVEQAVQARYYELVEVGGGVPEARSWAEKMTSGSDWRAVGFGAVLASLSLIVIVGGGFIFYQVLFAAGTTAEQKGMLVGALVAFISSVVSYWFGSSVGSKQSGDAVRKIAEGK